MRIYGPSLERQRMNVKERIIQHAADTSIVSLPVLCPANDLFHAYAHSHAPMLPQHNSMLYSIHKHEQERDDMIYPAVSTMFPSK